MHKRALLLVVMLIVGACGAADDVADPASTTDAPQRATAQDSDAERATAADVTSTTDATRADGGEATGDGTADPETSEDLPTTLAAFFGYGGEDFDADAAQAEYEQQERQVQDLIAQCMAAEGWEYTPYIPDYGDEFFFGSEEELDEDEYLRTYGFGISTYITEELNQYSSSEDQPVVDVEYDPNDDPNYVYAQSLTDTEREAYETALWGDHSYFDEDELEYDDEGNPIYPEYVPSGCYDEASSEIYGWGPDSELDAVWQELEPLYHDLYERIDADPRLAELRSSWSGCMAERGFTFSSEEEMYESIQEQVEPFYEAMYGSFAEPDFDDEGNPVDADGNPIDWETWEPPTPSLSDEQLAELEALNAYEISVAVADSECRGDYWDVYQEISEEYEADFIRSNLALLTQVRDLENG